MDGHSHMPGPFPQLIRFLLLTGARRSEAAEMVWSEFDEVTGDWSLPASRDKRKKGVIRPLSTAARAILTARPRLGAFVFTHSGRRPARGYDKHKAALDALMLKEMRRSNPKPCSTLGSSTTYADPHVPSWRGQASSPRSRKPCWDTRSVA